MQVVYKQIQHFPNYFYKGASDIFFTIFINLSSCWRMILILSIYFLNFQSTLQENIFFSGPPSIPIIRSAFIPRTESICDCI